MAAEIDIKALAAEIANNHSKRTIIEKCYELIDECDPDIDDYYTIEEDGVAEGFLGYDWCFNIGITPEVGYHLMGVSPGCDPNDCDHIVDDVDGIDCVYVYSVYFYDEDGNEYQFDEEQIEELEKTLYGIYK